MTVQIERAPLEHDVRPWGEYWVLADEVDHKVKRIRVTPGCRLSYQRHQLRDEHWLVVSGEACVTLEGEELLLGPGEAVDIPKRTAHRVANRGSADLVFVEVQQGSYFGEDDIERLEDDYGRTA
ncbi:MAG: glycosyltransferase [Frankiales bacterium]|nr:glycosyltransferase [Frankiales bacterium]